MYLLVISFAIDVKRAVEEVKTLPILEFITDIVEVLIAGPDPIKNSVIIINTFLLIKLLYFFLLY